MKGMAIKIDIQEKIPMIKISINIDLGNDDMLSDDDVARALEKMASRFVQNRYVEMVDAEGYDISRGVLDFNGNRIGDFTVSHIGK